MEQRRSTANTHPTASVKRAVLLTPDEARRLCKTLTRMVDYPELEPEDQELYDKLDAIAAR